MILIICLSYQQTISIKGNLKAADHTNFDEITSSNDIAYLSCDKSETSSYITPDKMLNDLMSQAPKAIVLYSTAQNWCSISYKGDLEYTTILSMTDTGEAESVLEHLNETSSHGKAGAFIYGSATKKTSIDSDGQSNSDGKSAVAMSVLYSITGLVTFLFLVIIVNGAIRAHRHPERYGPRRAAGGRPRQSRAKGLARAVLETLPVVKFGDQNPSKPDPELELADDAATTDGRRSPTAAGARDLVATEGVANAGSGSGSGSGPGAVASGSGDATASGSRSATPRASMASDPDSTAAAAAGAAAPRASTTSQSPPENPGCSICTEDFKVGEDMRVLPCHHQFHPECVDPWLVNVSGTCPLWYVPPYSRSCKSRC